MEEEDHHRSWGWKALLVRVVAGIGLASLVAGTLWDLIARPAAESIVRSAAAWLNSPHSVAGWLIVIIPVTSLVVGLSVAELARARRSGSGVVEADARGMRWRVRWQDGRIVELVELCGDPTCGGLLRWRVEQDFGAGIVDGYYSCDDCGYARHCRGSRGNVRAEAAAELRRSAPWRAFAGLRRLRFDEGPGGVA